MSKKRRYPVCGADITNRSYVAIPYNGKVQRCCPKCANEVIKNGKMDNGVNRMLDGRNVSVR